METLKELRVKPFLLYLGNSTLGLTHKALETNYVVFADSVGQDQSAQNGQSDVESTIAAILLDLLLLANTTLKKHYLGYFSKMKRPFSLIYRFKGFIFFLFHVNLPILVDPQGDVNV